MSNRLESLNSKKPSSSPKPSLRFKPKVVARKSKEERAKEAPSQIKQENGDHKPPGRDHTSGRGGHSKRGGRGNYSGTHLVSAGPLASGSVSIGNANGSKLGLTRDRAYNSVSPTPEFLQSLKLKDLKLKSKSPTPSRDDESDEEDPTKIDMNKEYRFADEETILFPVRPERDEYLADDLIHPVQSKETSTEPESNEDFEAEPSPVKDEPIETKLEQIKEHKAQLETKITETVDVLNQEESTKIISDYQAILNLVTEKFNGLNTEPNDETTKNNSYTLFHLPNVLPEYNNQDTTAEQLNTKDDCKTTIFASEVPSLRGQIGHLNIHKSGKISINLGNNNNLAVSQGSAAHFLQEVIMLEMNDTDNKEDVEMMNQDGEKIKGKLYRFGQAESKIIGTPAIH